MSQNNSDNAALYTAEANIVDANLKIAKLEYKLQRLNSVLDEIVESANIEGATQLTTGVSGLAFGGHHANNTVGL